jgi:hypothetical protein
MCALIILMIINTKLLSLRFMCALIINDNQYQIIIIKIPVP